MSSVEESFRACERLTKNHYENFPVGSFLVPKAKRKYVWAVYAFARTADDFADEGRHGHETPEEIQNRLKLLDDWERKLDDALIGKATDPIFIAVAQTLADLDIPHQLLRDLLTAYRMDVQKSRYQNFDEVLTYCRYSANPVGRLVLYIFGYQQPQLHELSDAICTALQLTNFWQDIQIDLQKNRIYIPQDLMAQHGFSEEELKNFDSGKQACADNPKFQAVMAACFEVTKKLFNQGLPLCRSVNKDLRWELRLTWLGGSTILQRTAQVCFDVFRQRPTVSGFGKFKLLLQAFSKKPLEEIL